MSMPPPSLDLSDVSLDWQGAIVCVVVGISLIIMGFDLMGPDLVFAAMASLFMAMRIITTKDGAEGFSNTGVLTVIALFVVAEGVTQTGGLDLLLNFMLGRTRSTFWAQVRMMIPVMICSAFLNNTPIVALMIPILISYSRRSGVPVKQLLIPMSFATVLGGTCTLIGTSTNLVVSGLQNQMFKGTPYANFNFFTITPYGVPYAIWGMIYLVLFSYWLLPRDDAGGHQDLLSGLLVPEDSVVVDKSVLEAGLWGKAAPVDLIGVGRGGKVLTTDLAQLVLVPGDVLYVSGALRNTEMMANENGLELVSDETEGKAGGGGKLQPSDDNEEHGSASLALSSNGLVQVTLRKEAPVQGKTIKEVGFRARFNAAVLAVKRSKVRQPGSLGQVELQEGDVLVLSVPADFNARSDDFTDNFEKLQYLSADSATEFTTAMTVTKDMAMNVGGKSIMQAGLRGIHGLYLFQITREDGTVLMPVESDTVIEYGDTLWFAGDLHGISYLRRMRGLSCSHLDQINKLPHEQIYRHLVQVVVSTRGPLVGRTVVEAKFRTTYNAVVVAVHRSGERLLGSVRDIRLAAGDLLLCEAGVNFTKKQNKAFALVSAVPDSSPLKSNRAIIAVGLTVIMVTIQVVEGAINKNVIHLWPCAMLVAALMILTKCMSTDQARKSIDWEIYICIAFAFAVGTAMEETGVANAIAALFVALSKAIGGQTAGLAMMYLVTALLSEVLTNNAAAAIMFPIAQSAAVDLGINPSIMSIALMLGGSAGWVLPYSYQCNLMVYAAGNYKTMDFIKIGAPYHIWLLAGSTVILYFQDRWVIPLVASLVLLIAVLIPPLIWEYALKEEQRNAIRAKMPKWITGTSRKDSPSPGYGRTESLKSISSNISADGKGLKRSLSKSVSGYLAP